MQDFFKVKLVLFFLLFVFKVFGEGESLDIVDEKVKVNRKQGEKDIILFVSPETDDPNLKVLSDEILESVKLLIRRKRNILPVIATENPDFKVPLYIKDFDEFKERRIDYIVTGFIYSSGEKYVYRIFVWDIYERQNILEEEYTFAHTDIKFFTYKFATRIYEFITGEYGFFYGKLLYTVTEREGLLPFKKVALSKKEGSLINAILFTNGNNITFNPNICKNEIIYSMQTKKEGLGLFIVNRLTGVTERLLIEKGFKTSYFSPSFSPHCQQIVFSKLEEEGTNIFIFDRKTEVFSRLTSSKNAINTSAVFSADMQKVYFVSDRNKRPRIFEMNIDGSAQKQLTSSEGFYFAPNASYDGKMLTFVHSYGGMFHLKTLDLKTNKEEILYSAFLIEDPVFAPSGKTVLFSMKKHAKDFSRIYFISSGMKEPEELDALKGFVNEPKWVEEF